MALQYLIAQENFLAVQMFRGTDGAITLMQPEHVSPDQQDNSDELGVLVGQSLGQYRLVENLGGGAVATVFKAYQPSLDRYVAVKILHASYASDPSFAQHFVYDARLAAKLAHPNITQIHDIDQQSNLLYIVMEYAEGGTLQQRLQKALPLGEALSFVIQASEALQYTHRHRVVHRNVKPCNMLLRQDGSLLLSDLGTTAYLVGKTNRLHASPTVGTSQYLSPEQGTGQAQDQRSDIYSLGIVLFHCLTGHAPFDAESAPGIITKHLLEPLPIEQLTQEQAVPDSVVQIILKMTAKQPAERYQSADAVIQALSNALVALKLPKPLLWRERRVSISSPSASGMTLPGQFSQDYVPDPPPQGAAISAGEDALVPCPYCGTPNQKTRNRCIMCENELPNNDQHLGANGLPLLARMSIKNGTLAGYSYLFHQGVTTIGRTQGNDFILPGRTVSRRHARLWFAAGHWHLEDLQSANGTLVNQVRIHQPVILNDRDVIYFGDEMVVFTIESHQELPGKP